MIIDDLLSILLNMQQTITFVALASIISIGFLYFKYKNGVILRIGLSIDVIASYSACTVDFFNYAYSYAGSLYTEYILIAVFFGVFLVILIGFYLNKTVIKPLNKIVYYNKELSEGNLGVKFELEWNRNDEIHALKDSYFKTISYLRELLKDLVDIIGNLTSSSELMASSSEELNASSVEITSITQKISLGAKKQVENVNTSKKLNENLTILFKDKFAELQKTAKIVENITSQVNMLALNASIESARAGEYGRGFAVVADNIRQLADDTKNSLQNIQSIVNDIESSMSKSIQEISFSIDSMTQIIDETVSGSETAFAATEEQVASMQELSSIAQEMASNAGRLKDRTAKFTF